MSEEITLDYKAVKLKLSKLKKRQNKLSMEIRENQSMLESICPRKDIKVEDSYIPGGYLDQSEYITTKICIDCGKQIDRRSKPGGFG